MVLGLIWFKPSVRKSYRSLTDCCIVDRISMNGSDPFQSLFFDTFHPTASPMSESLFRDELRRARKKSNVSAEGSLTPYLFDALTFVSSDLVTSNPLVNEPPDFPDFRNECENPYVKSRSVDLHGFNRYGALVVTRRMILNRDQTHAYQLKIGVGKGSHTLVGKADVVRGCAESVCREFGYEPFVTLPNEGYIEIEMPAVPENDNNEDGQE
jgi:hypothetical protein